jgi:glycosyltransferase involved in cell wall biosynthesis
MTGAADGHIHTRHGAFIQQHKALWRYRLLRRGVNKIVTVSIDGREELAKLSGLPVEQIGVVANGVDTNRFHPAADKVALRRELGLPAAAKLIIVAARLSPEKDLATLLRAFCLMLSAWDQRPACRSADNRQLTPDTRPRLLIVGDGPCMMELRNEANRLGITEQIDFLGMRTDVPQLLQAADVFALSSISEGLSMALIEAAGCGLPIVATAVGGNGEIVNAPAGGRLVPVRNPEAMAAALFAILDDEPGRQAMGATGRQQAIARFSLDRMVENYIALYQEALGVRK